ncbi:hypothetical protein ACROYT_G030367 [Oculina patagonica]
MNRYGRVSGEVLFSFPTGQPIAKEFLFKINPSSKLNVQVTGKDLDGRIVSINLIYNSAKISICNIYAPNDSQQQQKFLLTLNRYLMSHTEISNLIVGGDWNVTLQACYKKGGIPWRPTSYRDKLIAIMDDIGLIDVFRKLYPNERSFTYESKSLKVKSRIDFFLVSKSVENWVVKTNTKVSNAPDHKAVVLELKILSEKRGPGLWKFNNSLVEDNEYVELIEENYAAIREKYSDLKDDRLKWELIKMEIRRLTISYSKHKVKQRRIRETELQKRLEALEIKINNCNTEEQSSAEIEEYDNLKTELQRIYEAKGKGAIFRSKVRWIEQDEEREALEGYITIEECSKVLKTFPAGKSPGDDGFTAEFYNCFFDLNRRKIIFEELAWLVVAVILVTLIVNHFTTTRNLPPGSFPLPIIGNAHNLAADSRHVDLMELAKQYGKVFRLYLGSQLVVVVSAEKALKEVLVTKSAEFAGRPSFYTSEVYSKGKAIGFVDYSPGWRLHRKVVVSALKTYSTGKLNQGSVIKDEFDLLLKRVRFRNGQPHDITKEIRLAVMNVICALVFGSRYELNDPEFTRFMEVTHTIVSMLAAGSIVDVFPWLKFIPFKSIQSLKEKCIERNELFDRIYREHVVANRVANPRDLTDALLKAKQEAEEEDSSIKGLLTDQHLILTMSEIFIAGMETTGSTLCWAMLYLIHNPVVQQKLHQELDQVIGPDRLPELEDKKNLPYLEATITETLRLSSVGPLAIPHKATVDTTLQGYSIPKGTTVLTNLRSLHHDPEIWDEPNEFRPERFLNEGGNFVPPKSDRFLPFSAGRRGCFGESLARIEIFLVLARLLHSFKFENPPGCDLPTLEPIVGLVLMPRPFSVCALKRLAVCN